MSILKTKYIQIGNDLVANNNFTLYQPALPDGTMRIGYGNPDGLITDVMSIANTGVISVGSGIFEITGNTVFSSLRTTGNTTLGNSSDDVLTVNGGSLVFANNVTISGNTTFSNTVTISANTSVTNLSSSGVVSGTGFSTYLASPPAIGGTTPAAGNFTSLGATGNVTLGDASGDTLTINGTAVSCPNNLNFDSNTLFIDATNNMVGIGTSSPGAKLDIVGASSNQIRVGTAATEHYRIGRNASDGLLDFYGSQTGFQGYRFGGIDGTWATINSSGNLGLGVTPSAWTTGFKAVQISSLSTLYQDSVSNTILSNNSENVGNVNKYITTAGASLYLQNAGQHLWFTAPSGTAGSLINGSGSFTQAMTLTAAGELLIGTTTDNGAYLLQVNSQIWATNATIATSDARLKENVAPIQNALFAINKMEPVAFDFIQGTAYNLDSARQTGFIAQDLQAAIANEEYADCVVKECGPYLGVAYEKLIPVLVKSIQELSARLETLENKVN
nr:MAG: hypothetical protein [Caudoviricetes sp.]